MWSLPCAASRSPTRTAATSGTRRPTAPSSSRWRLRCATTCRSRRSRRTGTITTSPTSWRSATSPSSRRPWMPDRPVSNCLLDLAPPDIAWFQERSDIVLVPIGSCEQYGAHLPLGTDTITALEVSRRAAEKADVPYTAPLWIGYSPQHMREVESGVGTVTLRASTFTSVLYDILRSLIHHGWNKLILVNGHGSNTKVIDPLLRRIKYETGALVGLYKPYAERYIGILEGLLENPPEETPGWHASELETSQVLAHNASLVRMARAAEDRAQAPPWLPDSFLKRDGAPDTEFEGYQYFSFPMDHGEFSRTGVIGNPMRATAEKGEAALQRFADHLVRAIDEFRGLDVQVHRRAFEERV